MKQLLRRNLYSHLLPLAATALVAGWLIRLEPDATNPVHLTAASDLAVVTITATMTDVLLVDGDNDGNADQEDTLQYTVIIVNSGDMDATGVSFDETLDSNLTLVPGTVETTPLARPDTHAAIGNIGIDVPAGSGVLTNDDDPDGSGLAGAPISAFDNPSTNGGAVNVNADGSFTYNPPSGFEGTDTFNYTIEDGEGNSDVGTVSIIVSDPIWFIDNTGGGSGGSGTLADPFKTIADFNTSADPDPGDNIYLAETGTDYSTGINLQNDQTVVGEGASGPDLQTVLGIVLPVHSDPLPPVGGTNPVITNGSGNAVNLASGNTVRGLTVGNTSGIGITGSAVGTLTVTDVAVNGMGEAIDIDGGVMAVTFDSLETTSSTNQGIDLNNVSGSFTVTGTTGVSSVAGNGIDITSNAATFTFNSVNVATTSGTAFLVTGGGTVNVTGVGSTISTTTGVGANITNTTIGASGVTFQSVSVNGASNGIILNNTGTTGGFTVTGDGTDNSLGGNDSGGVLQSTSGTAIDLDVTHDFNIRSMRIQTPGGDGINALNISGSNSIKNVTIDDVDAANTSAVHILNNTVSLTDFHAHKSEFTDATTGQTMFLVEGGGAIGLTMQVRVDSSEFSDLDPAAYQHTAGLAVGDNPTVTTFLTNNDVIDGKVASIGTSEVNLLMGHSGHSRFVVENNVFDNVGLFGVNNGILNVGGNSDMNGGMVTGLIKGNDFSNIPGKTRAINALVEPATGAPGTIDITIDNNRFDDLAQAHPTTPNGQTAIFVDMREDVPTSNIRIINNSIGQGAILGTTAGMVGGTRDGIFIREDDDNFVNTMNLLIQDNSVSVSNDGTGTSGDQILQIESDDISTRINATIHGNVFNNTAIANLSGGTGDVAIRSDDNGSALCLDLNAGDVAANSNAGNQDAVLVRDNGATFETEGTSGTDATVETFLNARNTINVDAQGDGGGGFTNAACPEPPAAPVINPVLAADSGLPPAERERVGPEAPDTPAREAEKDLNTSVIPAAATSVPDVSVAVGILPAGKSITITFDAGVNNTVNALEVCNQGTVSGGNFSSVLTDDPDDPTSSADPTCTSLDAVLPVELVELAASVDGARVALFWVTASETNNAGFEVEHACNACQDASNSGVDSDGLDWTVLGFVEGRGTTAEPQTYGFVTVELAPGFHVFRLKQIDFDGAYEYSDVVEVQVELPGLFVLEQSYPNPFNPKASIRFGLAVEQHAILRMYDLGGRVVKTLFDGVPEAGVLKTVRIDGEGLASGTYMVRLETDGFAESRTVVLLK